MTTAAGKILLVEDDPDIRELIRLTLESQGYEVWAADDGRRGLELFRAVRPDLALLDVLLPGMTGLELCKELRRQSDAPIVFLSCKREADDVIEGLELGADDYMTKPFDPAELVARVRARLRRLPGAGAKAAKLGALEIDWPGRDVKRNGQSLPLFTKERQLLFFLLEHPNQVFSIAQLYERVWGMEHGSEEQTVKVHISNLRRKIEDDPANPKWIVTVRGFGYKLLLG
ncbi:response regulator transcription factor [Paenibacillus sp.]|uniref:response regulator transcription factor n=1 Tax=Paenibacillus sp. TaxID=58172 RepID=UPI002D3A6421|nr:response regulator transcription factor [Paenibacillus sp.]HZG57993.1 response regulator transcription factor [Paenibacillus sp.]